MSYLNEDLSIDAIMELTVQRIGDFCDDLLDAEILIDEVDGEIGGRKGFCEYLGVGESTLTGWLKEDRIPRMAKEAYILKRMIAVLKEEIKKTKNDLKIIKSRNTYQICQFKEDEDGVLMGHIIVEGIINIKVARLFVSSIPALQLLNEAKLFINDEIDMRDGFLKVEHLEDLRSKITNRTLFATNYDEWKSMYGKNRHANIEVDIGDLEKFPNKKDMNTSEHQESKKDDGCFGKKHQIVINDKEFSADSLSEILIWVLLFFHEKNDGFLKSLSQKKKRGKRPYIATTRDGVYPGNVDLLRTHPPIEVSSGFYVGTNYGVDDIIRILKKGVCDVAGVAYGKHLQFISYSNSNEVTLENLGL